MYTSIVLLALASSAAPATEAPQAPEWLSDYAIARKTGESDRKPLALVFGKGERGWDQLGSDGKLGKEAEGLLQSRYVPVYLDLGTEYGKNLAAAFRVKDAPALVITDRSGENLALRYTGTIEAGDLRRCLVKYADPDRVVRSTDTDPNLETRYYPATGDEEGPRTYRAALAAAQKGKRPLLLVFHAERCVLCKKMERETFADAGVKAALRKYVVYFVDTDREPAVTRQFLAPPGALPAYCVVEPAAETVRKDGTGHKEPEEFLEWLE